jgi:hypothetical protein
MGMTNEKYKEMLANVDLETTVMRMTICIKNKLE